MKNYNLVVQTSDFKKTYTVKALNLIEASNKAKQLFNRDFNRIGYDVKVTVDFNDIENHIDEIIGYLYTQG